MCPEPQLLSIYYDGELPSPWKEKMENHLTGCSKCKEKFEKFKLLRQGEIPNPKPETIDAAKDKVWQNLGLLFLAHQSMKMQQKSMLFAGQEQLASNQFARVWRRRVRVPLPLAAAAAIVIAILGVFILRGGISRQVPEYGTNMRVFIAEKEDMPIPSIIPAADMSSLIQQLGYGTENIIILRLPESRNFAASGEPAIIRAADYSRRQR